MLDDRFADTKEKGLRHLTFCTVYRPENPPDIAFDIPLARIDPVGAWGQMRPARTLRAIANVERDAGQRAPKVLRLNMLRSLPQPVGVHGQTASSSAANRAANRI